MISARYIEDLSPARLAQQSKALNLPLETPIAQHM